MKTLIVCSVFEKIRVRTERIRIVYARQPKNAQEVEIYRARRQRLIRKSVLVPSQGNDKPTFSKNSTLGTFFENLRFWCFYAWTERLNRYVWTGLRINPLSPKSDQDEISPCKINAL